MRSGLVQDEVGSDLYSTNLALQAEYDELELELDDIDKTNDALRATIMAKYEQKADLVNAIFDSIQYFVKTKNISSHELNFYIFECSI